MNDKYSENYLNYQQSQCSKQIQQSDAQTLYSFSNISLNGTFSQTANFMDICNISQNTNITQHSGNYLPISTYQEQMDLLNWENRLLPEIEKTIKATDKMELIEITTKDLSPVSYCSNMDLFVTDRYKSNSACHSKYDSQWYSQAGWNQRINFPSCAHEKSSIFSSIQKNLNTDPTIRNYPLNPDIFSETSDIAQKNYKNISNDLLDYNSYNYYDGRSQNQQIIQNSCVNTTALLQNGPVTISIDQQADGSNGESDIIVEESDEEITDYSEDQEKQIFCETNRCLICNIVYTPLGTQFYFITTENPLTMSSQKPVYTKIVNLVGKLSKTKKYLCSECLGLINTVDHLQFKLESFYRELTAKFKKTCITNGVRYNNKPINKEQKVYIKFPRYKCKICKKIVCFRRYCYYHIKRHKSQGYLCELCGHIASNKPKFLVHLKRHRQKVTARNECLQCSNCNKSFRTKSYLKEHENYCLGTLPFICTNQHCDKKFASTTKLKNHIKLKHDKKFLAICSICNIGFVKMSEYKSHMVSHSTDKKYSCTKCDKSYKTLGNLNFHMKMHNKKLPFSCHICEKGFMRKEYLEAHVNNHQGIKNFGCTICDKKFALQKNLDAHLKYHDGTAKKNKCNICGKLLSTGFEEHLRVHNNLREFECDHCDMKFNTKSSLAKHIRKKHSDHFNDPNKGFVT